MKSKNIIDLMVKNEEAFARLYRKYSALYPNPEFWTSLVKEEIQHTQWLKALAGSSDTHLTKMNELTFSIVENLGKTVEAEISSRETLPLENAFKKALAFEQSFFEKDYFTIFSDCSPSVKKVFENLKSETRDHIEQIKREYEGLLNN